jgi:hypothetical protein
VRCPNCHSQDCLQIEIDLQGEPVQFIACRICEAKWWEHDGGTIDLNEVLTLAAKKDEE